MLNSFNSVDISKETSLKSVVRYMIPLALTLFSTGLMGFIDRQFLSQYLDIAMKGSAAASSYLNLFQIPFIKIVMMVQVFVGIYTGAQQTERIGACVWQLLWTSLLALGIILPLGFISMPYFFSDSPTDVQGSIYFKWMLSGTIFSLINACLSTFFLTLGRNMFIFKVNLLIQCIHLILDKILIFGIADWIPSLGILGAAWAFVISQVVYTGFLFYKFLHPKFAKVFHTYSFALSWEKLWSYFKHSFQRGLGQLNMFAAWALIVKMISGKHEDYLLVFAVGSSIFLSISCLFDSLFQTLTTKISYLIGANQQSALIKLLSSALVIFFTISIITFTFFYIYPEWIFWLFFNNLSESSYLILKSAFAYFWLHILFLGLCTIAASIIVAFKDMKFYMVCNVFTWFTLLFAYIAFEYFHWGADKVWLISAFDTFLFTSIYFLRAVHKKYIVLDLKEKTITDYLT